MSSVREGTLFHDGDLKTSFSLFLYIIHSDWVTRLTHSIYHPFEFGWKDTGTHFKEKHGILFTIFTTPVSPLRRRVLVFLLKIQNLSSNDCSIRDDYRYMYNYFEICGGFNRNKNVVFTFCTFTIKHNQVVCVLINSIFVLHRPFGKPTFFITQ